MEFTIQIIIVIGIIALISIIYITTHIFDASTSINSSGPIKIIYAANENWQPTPYTIETIPTTPTPVQTPIPLYYEKLKNPDEPCQETMMIYEKCQRELISDEDYCKYWTYQYRKVCPGARW